MSASRIFSPSLIASLHAVPHLHLLSSVSLDDRVGHIHDVVHDHQLRVGHVGLLYLPQDVRKNATNHADDWNALAARQDKIDYFRDEGRHWGGEDRAGGRGEGGW